MHQEILLSTDLQTLGRVPWVVAADPGQIAGERSEEEVQRPGDDDVVEKIHVESNEYHGKTDSYKDGTSVQWSTHLHKFIETAPIGLNDQNKFYFNYTNIGNAASDGLVRLIAWRFSNKIDAKEDAQVAASLSLCDNSGQQQFKSRYDDRLDSDADRMLRHGRLTPVAKDPPSAWPATTIPLRQIPPLAH